MLVCVCMCAYVCVCMHVCLQWCGVHNNNTQCHTYAQCENGQLETDTSKVYICVCVCVCACACVCACMREFTDLDVLDITI